ncbi:PTPLA-domain-containing protein [Russula earlei]|uniref:PTPLA-domain-containing protein n=1 Tax=Russula earlei TaxID=71964 RepID=A0ACC0UGT8_9AGAM|nr:PTPLA-domain-containing protein [Russula earlei]
MSASPPVRPHRTTKANPALTPTSFSHQRAIPSNPKTLLLTTYLVAYNVLSAAGWFLVLYRTLAHLLSIAHAQARPRRLPPRKPQKGEPPALARLVPFYLRACTTYDAVGETTARVQTVAVLEILHVLLGLVRSPLPTTAVQVASRLFSVWGIAARFPSAQRSPFYASMVFSWALTEVIRYTFYAASLVRWEPALLLWARYSTFFVLYPTGAGSEALVNLATLPFSVATGGSWFSALPLSHWDAFALLRGLLFIAWWPGLYPMYAHMIKQRRKVYAGQKLGARPKTH